MSRAKPRFTRINVPLPVPGYNVYEVTCVGLIEGQQTINTFYYGDDNSAPPSSREFDLQEAWYTAFATNYRACMSSDWTWTDMKVSCLTLPTRLPYQVTIGLAGTGPAGHEPTTVATLISRYSGFKGQSGRGRVYLPAVPTTWVTASTITAAGGLTAYAAFMADMHTAVTDTHAVTFTAQIVSIHNRQSNKSVRAAPCLSAVFRPLLASCRRRRIGRGK